MSSSPSGRLVVVRHGRTSWSAAGKHTGSSDIPLDPTADDATRALEGTLRDLGVTRAVSSPLQRARRTAELAGFPDAEVDPDLAEWDYGAWEGMTRDEIRILRPDWTPWTSDPVGGETAADVTARAARFLDRVGPSLDAGETVAAFCHGHFSRLLMLAWTGLPLTAGAVFPLAPTHVCVLGLDRGQRVLQQWNLPPTRAEVAS